VLHFMVAPLPESGPYQLYWDWRMLPTLISYVNWSFGTGWLRMLNINSFAIRSALALPLAAGLCALLFWKIKQRQWIVLLFPAWFVIVLAPLLTLREHMSYEYLTVPVIGLAMWGGWAIASGWRSQRMITVLLAAIYICVSIPVGHAVTAQFHDRSIRIRDAFYAVEALHRDHPDAMVLFKGASTEMFVDMIYHHAFGLIGISETYIVPGDEASIDLRVAPEAGNFFINPAVERKALEEGRAVVYDLQNGVRDVTAEYRSPVAQQQAPRPEDSPVAKVEVGNPVFADQLGPTWYSSEGSYRWMPQRASVTLSSIGRKLIVKGFCPAAALKNGPITVQVTADGKKLQSAIVNKPESDFELSFDLPAASGARRVIEVELDRTFHVPGDGRELGLPFTSFEIRNRPI